MFESLFRSRRDVSREVWGSVRGVDVGVSVVMEVEVVEVVEALAVGVMMVEEAVVVIVVVMAARW